MRSYAGIEFNTFTAMARCARTGMLGVASSTRSLAVGARVPGGRSRVGVVAFQAVADPRMTSLALRLLDLGYHAQKVLLELESADPHADLRQIGVIDSDGNAAAKTGARARDWAGHIVRRNQIAMGNVLTGQHIVQAMADVLERTEEQPLEERLLACLEAARDAGGQHGGQKSASLLVYDTEPFARVDLRVDVHEEPIGELRRVFDVYKEFIPYYNERAANPDIAPLFVWQEQQRKLKS
ncbi:MAG: DUF1028 domain-containing protein [Reyranellaceae bacterium]